jgi:hypothetical protein
VLDNAEEEHAAAGFYPVLEMVQEVHDRYLFDSPNGEIPIHSQKKHKHKLWPVFQSWKWHAGIRPARDDGKSLLKCFKWRSRKKKKLKTADLVAAPYRNWLQTEVHDVNSYIPDSQVNWYQAVAHDENVYWSDLQGDGSVGPRIWLRRAKQTVRAIDADYLCDEIARNLVSGFRSLSDNSLKRIQETNGM